MIAKVEIAGDVDRFERIHLDRDAQGHGVGLLAVSWGR